MRSNKVISDALVKKRLRKIQKNVLKDAKRKVRKGELSGESLELFLPSVSEHYDHLRAELDTGHGGALARIRHSNAALIGEIENAVNTLGNDRHRLQQAYETAQKLAADADIAATEILAEDKVTIEPLRERLAKFTVPSGEISK